MKERMNINRRKKAAGLLFIAILCVMALVMMPVSAKAAEYERVVPDATAPVLGLWVGETEVTDSATGEVITASNDAEGWSYDKDTNILTLNNANIPYAEYSSVIDYEGGDLIIELVGENILNTRDSYYTSSKKNFAGCGIDAGDMHIIGGGSLKIEGGISVSSEDSILTISEGVSISCTEIDAGGVIICDSTVELQTPENNCALAVAATDLVIKRSNITVNSKSSGILVYRGDMTVEDSVLTINSTDDSIWVGASVRAKTLTAKNSQIITSSARGYNIKSSVKDYTNVICGEKGDISVIGDAVLKDSLTVAEGESLTIPEGGSLTVAEGVKLTMLGTLDNSGSIITNGETELPDTMTREEVLALGITGSGSLRYGENAMNTSGACLVHSFIDRIAIKDDAEHYTRVCEVCGSTDEQTAQEHAFVYERPVKDGQMHKASCGACGFEQTEACSYIECSDYCAECGLKTRSVPDTEHIFVYTQSEGRDSGHSYECENCVRAGYTSKCTYEFACSENCSYCGRTNPAGAEHNGQIISCGDGTHDIICSICSKTVGEGVSCLYTQVIDDAYLLSDASCISARIYYLSCECGHKSSETFTYGETDPGSHTKSQYDLVSCNDGTHDLLMACCGAAAAEGVLCTRRDCTSTSLCDCGYLFKAEDGHSFADEYTYDSEFHWRECLSCEQTADKDYHNGRGGDCTSDVVCGCGYVMSEAQGHIFEGLVFYDDTHHYEACSTCGTPADSEGRIPHDFSVPRYDDFEHWTGCSGCDARINASDHSGEDDGDCTTPTPCECGYEIPGNDQHSFTDQPIINDTDGHYLRSCELCGAYDEDSLEEHTYPTRYDYTKYNETEHWQFCTVCYFKTSGEHSYYAQCSKYCQVCYYDRGTFPNELHNMNYSQGGGGKHGASCSDCNLYQNQSCTFESVCSAVCKYCGGANPNVTDHSYTVTQSDQTHHWNKCETCDEITSKTAHSYTAAQSDSTDHWNKCSGCDAIDAKINHSAYDDGDCTTEQRCSCGAVMIEKTSHKFDNACDTDCNNTGCEHTRSIEHTPEDDDYDCTTDILCSVCDTVTTKGNEAHTGGTATCEAKAVCDECGTKYGEIADHEYGENDICTSCGSEKPVTPPDTPDEPDTPDQPETPDEPETPEKPDKVTTPDTEEEELGFFERIIKFFADLFRAIGDFFASLFGFDE